MRRLYLRKAKMGAYKEAIEIIKNVNTIRDIHEHAPVLRQMDLRSRSSGARSRHFPDFSITYAGTEVAHSRRRSPA